jgi:hypothetical protein
MKLFSRFRKSFVFAALVCTMLLSSAFLPSGSGGGSREVCAASQYGHSTFITYYNDAAHTTEIGTRYIRCNGKATTTGSTSPYYTSEIVDVCCGSVPC